MKGDGVRPNTIRPELLDLTADYADHADGENIRAISEIRGQYAWTALRWRYKSRVRLV